VLLVGSEVVAEVARSALARYHEAWWHRVHPLSAATRATC